MVVMDGGDGWWRWMVAYWKVCVIVPVLANPSGSVAGMTNHVQPSCSLLPGCFEEGLREQGAMKRIR